MLVCQMPFACSVGAARRQGGRLVASFPPARWAALPRACWLLLLLLARCCSHVVQLPEQSGVLFGGVRGASLNWRIMGQDARDRRPALVSGIELGLAVSDLVAVFGPRYQRRSLASAGVGACWGLSGREWARGGAKGACVVCVSFVFSFSVCSQKTDKVCARERRWGEGGHPPQWNWRTIRCGIIRGAHRAMCKLHLDVQCGSPVFDSRRRPRVSPNSRRSRSVPFITVNGRNGRGGASFIKHGLSMRPVSVACLSPAVGCVAVFPRVLRWMDA